MKIKFTLPYCGFFSKLQLSLAEMRNDIFIINIHMFEYIV
jgi:hypothetical protein